MTTPTIRTRNCYVFDIDGTLADLTHRLHYIQKSPKDWDGFFSRVGFDTPIDHIGALVCRLYYGYGSIAYVSGRPERTRRDTEVWLDCIAALPAPPHNAPLYMRADGDRRDDTIVKAELLAKLRADGFEPIMAFDDRDRVVSMWRSHGIPCAQVAPGNF